MQSRLAKALTLCTTFSCTPVVAPAIPFLQSAAFHHLQPHAQSVLEPNSTTALVAEQHGDTYQLTVLRREAEDWATECQSPALPGEDLSTFRQVGEPNNPMLLMVATHENPDDRVDNAMVIDTAAGCAVRWRGGVRAGKPDGVFLTPESYPAGFRVSKDGTALHYADHPVFVTLQAERGQLTLLAHMREHTVNLMSGTVSGGGTQIEDVSEPRDLLHRYPVQVSLRVDPEHTPISELADNRDDTVFIVKPNDSGALELHADHPLLLLELHHGCNDVDAGELTLNIQDAAKPYVLGKPIGPTSPVMAAGRRPQGERVIADVVALRQAAAHLKLAIGPSAATRCLREIIAYGW